MHIKFEDKGGLMGFELLPIEPGDEDRYETFTITSPQRWTPQKFVNANHAPCFYDPTDAVTEVTNYPACLDHLLLNMGTLGENDLHNDPKCQNDHFDMTDMTLPIMESHVLATATWHRVTHKDIDPNILRPFLGYRPKKQLKRR